VWQVLQALHSHDDRFDAMVNKLELNGPNVQKMEVIAITDKVQKKQRKALGEKKPDGTWEQTFRVGRIMCQKQIPAEQAIKLIGEGKTVTADLGGSTGTRAYRYDAKTESSPGFTSSSGCVWSPR